MESLRTLLYFPLGTLPALFFTSRMLFQWLQSEKKGRSVVSPLFWRLSLCGNSLLLLHHTLQIQFHFALLQAINVLISWRNLNLFHKHPVSRKGMLGILVATVAAVAAAFVLQGVLFASAIEWIRTPTKLLNESQQHHSIFWHLFGALGATLFASRLWVQWWMAEYHKRSHLGRSYWYLSISGSMIVLLYSLRIQDVVVMFYNCFSLIPYIRNLILLRRGRHDLENRA